MAMIYKIPKAKYGSFLNLLSETNSRKFDVLQHNIIKAELGTEMPTSQNETFDATNYFDPYQLDISMESSGYTPEYIYSLGESAGSPTKTTTLSDSDSILNNLMTELNNVYNGSKQLKRFGGLNDFKHSLLLYAGDLYKNAVKYNWPETRIIGLLANSIVESAWIPNKLSGTGKYKGMFQMGGAERRNFEKFSGNNYTVANQMAYLNKWLDTSYGLNYLAAHNSATSAESSAEAFARFFERCGKGSYSARKKCATILNKYWNQLKSIGIFK